MAATHITARERTLAALATAITLALFGYALVRGLTVEMQARLERSFALLDLRVPPPPPPPKPPVARKAMRHARAPAPPDLARKATPVVVPPPIVPPVSPPPIVVAQRAGAGLAAATGASDRPGAGEGAGGEGNGTGGGGDGDDDGDNTPPRLIKGRLRYSDLPADLRAAGVGGRVGVRYHVETDGHVTDCAVAASSGNVDLDALACRLIKQRFRFVPSHDRDGRPVPSTIVESHNWVTDRDDDAAP